MRSQYKKTGVKGRDGILPFSPSLSLSQTHTLTHTHNDFKFSDFLWDITTNPAWNKMRRNYFYKEELKKLIEFKMAVGFNRTKL
jgi:hypothetical protein